MGIPSEALLALRPCASTSDYPSLISCSRSIHRPHVSTLSGRRSLSPVPAPLRTVRAPFTAHGSSKPIHSSAYGVSPSGSIQPLVRPLDTLLAKGSAHPYPIRGLSVYHLWGQLTCSTSARFRVGYGPIQQVVYSLCLSAAGVGFLEHPIPAEELTRSYDGATNISIRPHRGFPVPHTGDTAGAGAYGTPSSVVCLSSPR